MSLEVVRTVLADALKPHYGSSGWRVYPHLRAVTQTPCVIIQPSVDVEIPSAEYETGSGFGVTKWYLDIIILSPFANMDLSTKLIDKAVSGKRDIGSIPWVLDFRNTPSLKETFRTLRVPKMRDYAGKYVNNDINAMGACIKIVAEEHCA